MGDARRPRWMLAPALTALLVGCDENSSAPPPARTAEPAPVERTAAEEQVDRQRMEMGRQASPPRQAAEPPPPPADVGPAGTPPVGLSPVPDPVTIDRRGPTTAPVP